MAGEVAIRVARASPAQAEAKLAFGSLGDLLEGVAGDTVVHLPVPQRRALGAALLLEEVEGRPDQRTVAVALLNVVRRLAGAGPVLRRWTTCSGWTRPRPARSRSRRGGCVASRSGCCSLGVAATSACSGGSTGRSPTATVTGSRWDRCRWAGCIGCCTGGSASPCQPPCCAASMFEDAVALAPSGPRRAEALLALAETYGFEGDLRAEADLYRAAIAEAGTDLSIRPMAEQGLTLNLLYQLRPPDPRRRRYGWPTRGTSRRWWSGWRGRPSSRRCEHDRTPRRWRN
jgi:hypothetical protein